MRKKHVRKMVSFPAFFLAAALFFGGGLGANSEIDVREWTLPQ